MFREIRRKDRLVSDEIAIATLNKVSSGVLSVLGDDDYPYGVPVNFVYKDKCIYIHCYLDGHKVESVKKHPKVCFTVVGNEEVMKTQISTNYTSVIVFGKAELCPPPDNELRKAAFAAIMEKYVPNDEAITSAYIEKNKNNTNLIKINIEHMTCKQRDIR